MKDNHIYPLERDLDGAKRRIADCRAPKSVKDKIFEFVTYVKETSGIKAHREIFYYARLQVLAELMQEKLLNPSKEDVINAIGSLRSTKTNRHTYYSAASMSDFKKVLKKFVGYVNEDKLPRFWKDIHAEKIGPRYSRPSDMITYDELQVLLEACKNRRDKAMISLLWDSGVRASELLKLRIKDFQRSPDSLYATLNIEEGSKTYKQRVVVLIGDSVVLVDDWLREKERKKDDFLFIGIGKEKPGQPLDYTDLRAMLRKVLKRSKLEKTVSPHLFRHSAATRMAAEKIPTQVFVRQMGWASNRMADNYTHLDEKGQIMAILQSQGIEITDEELNKPVQEIPRYCPRCHALNTGGARFCNNCGSPLKMEDYRKIEEERQIVVSKLKESNLISREKQEMLDSVTPELQNELLLIFLKGLKEEGKFDLLMDLVRKPTEISGK